jgi:hypothetical protein
VMPVLTHKAAVEGIITVPCIPPQLVVFLGVEPGDMVIMICPAGLVLLVNMVLNGLCMVCILRLAIFCSCSEVSCRGLVERLVVSVRCCPWKTHVGCSYSAAVSLTAAVVVGVRSNCTEPVSATKL